MRAGFSKGCMCVGTAVGMDVYKLISFMSKT